MKQETNKKGEINKMWQKGKQKTCTECEAHVNRVKSQALNKVTSKVE